MCAEPQSGPLLERAEMEPDKSVMNLHLELELEHRQVLVK